MTSTEFGLIAADTSRTRAYLTALEKIALLPAWVLLLEGSALSVLPGQARAGTTGAVSDPDWPEADFDPTVPLRPWLTRLGLNTTITATRDINDPDVVALIGQCAPDVLVYSGYGGALLRDAVLATGKHFLHVHGGYLPDYKGSTTNYYSLLAEDQIGASSLFLTATIDSGPVLRRRCYAKPAHPSLLDHVYDAAVRARVLIETLQAWRQDGEWTFELLDNAGGETYYIIHPVLKHLAILSVR